MTFEKIIGHLKNGHSKNVDSVPFEWFEREKHILKKTASSGEEIGLKLSEPLCDGGILYEDEKRIIALELLPCEIIRIAVNSMSEMGRLCFEIGNRHLPLTIKENLVETPYESPTFEYLKKIGFSCEKTNDKFAPSVIVRGHGHSHEH